MRLVLDTNVIVSAALWGGVPREVLETAHDKHQLCFSLSTLQELEEVLAYPKFNERLSNLSFSIEEFMERVTHNAIVIPDPPEEDIIQDDPTDNKFLACAVACQAKLIISGDSHLLQLKQFNEITILEPKLALKLLE